MDPNIWEGYSGSISNQRAYYTAHPNTTFVNPNTESGRVRTDGEYVCQLSRNYPERYGEYDQDRQNTLHQQPDRETEYSSEADRGRPQYLIRDPYHFDTTGPKEMSDFPNRDP